MSKEMTQPDALTAFIDYINYLIDESSDDKAVRSTVRSTVFSILCAIDGVAMTSPGFDLVCKTCPGDKEYYSNRDKDYYQNGMIINPVGSPMMHELLYVQHQGKSTTSDNLEIRRLVPKNVFSQT